MADGGNHRIKVFSPMAKEILMFGERGQGMGELSMPYHIAVDDSGIVFVSERGNCRVSVFSSEGGHFVTSFGSKGDGQREFNFPCGLAVDGSGVVYICDCVNNVVRGF